MVSEIYFDDSMGGSELLTDFEWLKDKVFNGNDGFWEGATGQAALGYGNEKVHSSLIITGRESHGFFLNHRYRGEKNQSLRYGEHTGETVEAETGGEPSLYFKEYFVPKDVAWQAIEYFLKTGKREPNLTWEIAQYPKQTWEN